jgi:hypothetical protein
MSEELKQTTEQPLNPEEYRHAIEDLAYKEVGQPIFTVESGPQRVSINQQPGENFIETTHSVNSKKQIVGVALNTGETDKEGLTEYVVLGIDGSAVLVSPINHYYINNLKADFDQQTGSGCQIGVIERTQHLDIAHRVLDKISGISKSPIYSTMDKDLLINKTQKAMEFAKRRREEAIRNKIAAQNQIGLMIDKFNQENP